MERIQRLEMRNITRRFNETVALHEFNLDIPGGTFVTLLGPSGCGKSTALNCLAGLLELSSGQIIVDGKPVEHVPAEKRGFGMVFQNYALFPHMTVTQNVRYGLEIHPMSAADRDARVTKALQMVKLDPATFGKRYPAQLSGGQQQRLAIARTIALEPKLLLMDEPLSNLDAKLRGEMRFEIKRLHQMLGLTTIYVTHDQEEAMSLSDFVIVMRAGKIEQSGTPQDIYDCPQSLYVADFMGYTNRLPVTTVSVQGQHIEVKTTHGVTLHGSLTTGNPEAVKPGQRMVACMRADDLQAEGDMSVNALSGTVQLTEYVGKSYKAAVSMEGLPDLQLVVTAKNPPTYGSVLQASVRPDRLLLFPAEA